MTQEEKEEMKDAALDIMSRIMFYGDWKAETYSERTLEGLMKDLGYWPTTEEEILKRPDRAQVHMQNITTDDTRRNTRRK